MNKKVKDRYIDILRAYIECLKYVIKSKLENKQSEKWCVDRDFAHGEWIVDTKEEGFATYFPFSFDSKEEGEKFIKDNKEHLDIIKS